MSLISMQQPVEFDLEELESRLYSQVFHSTENWDQTPNHPVLTKVPEQRQISTYSISNHAVNSSRYWDGKTQTIQQPPTEQITEKPTETSDTPPLPNNTENSPQNNETNKETVKTVGHVEEYIGFDKNDTNNPKKTAIDFSKDDLNFQQNFFSNSQDKLIQQSEIEKNNLNNNIQSVVDSADPFSSILSTIKELEKENTKQSRLKAKRLRRILKKKKIKQIRRDKRELRKQTREENRLRKLEANSNNFQSFSFVDQFNSLQQTNANVIEKQSPINEIRQQPQQELIKSNINHLDETCVILSDSGSDNDDVIEVPLPKAEIVCIDSSSENSDTEDSVCAVDSIVEKTTITNLPSQSKTPNLPDELNVPNSPKLENDCKTSDINSEVQLKSESEINIDDTSTPISSNINEEDNKVEIEVMKDVISMSENEEKNDEVKSPKQKSNTLINEIEKERAELLCTPDSNTNDFIVNDVCHLNKTNFCFNFNLHQDDLGMTGKEISKSGPSITDVYETESSCSEAGTTSKNQSYFAEVDFENPIKEIFAEPDLAKFSSFITPIRNRNISNVADSTPDLTPVKTKAGVVSKLDLFQDKNLDDSGNSDEYESDPTVLPVKKKHKKKKKKAKKKDTNEEENNEIEDNTIETESNTETVNKNKKSKKRSKIMEESNNESMLSNQSDSPTEKLSKSKERKLKKKNKRKSGQLENETPDSSNKKPKNIIDNCSSPQNTHDTTEQSLSTKNATSTKESTTDSYFADDLLYEELKNKTNTSTETVNDLSNNDIINIDTFSDDSKKNIEKFSFMNAIHKPNENETQTINISSDSETEETSPKNNERNSSNSANMVLNIFSPEKEKSNENNHVNNIVANPFSFVQNYEKLNQDKKSFKDFWTHDMNTFYNDSWGHENYDLTAVQQSMSSDFSKWSVNPADQSPTKGKKRGPMCLRCREFGHLQYRCPKLHEAIKCTTCGDYEHTYNRCPKSICTTCRSSTQHHTTSCNNCSNYKTLRCSICHYIGHLPRDCPDLWRRYHLTTRDNNSLVVPNQMLKPPNMQWCSNCAIRGHSANNCSYLRTDHFPTYPGIQNYTPVYNNIPPLLQSPPEPQIPVRIFDNVNLSQITNYRTELVENNNKKYLNMIKNLRRHVGKSDCDTNLSARLNYLYNAASRNRFNKRNVGELYKISKMLRNSR